MTTPVPSGAPVFSGSGSDVSRRLDGLTNAVTAARGRIDDEILAPAEMLSERATERLTLSGEHTIVALAGATGSGKSSLFNSLTDLELAGVGVRRPTTSWALACAWGPDGAQGLLEWMGIPARHQVSRMSMLDRSAEDTKLDGLVLLDLPDHDSTEVSHHVEMDRLVTHADLLVWVLDPQKYADAAIHDRYIRPMASYSDVTLVVLNQIDRIPFEQRDRALADVRRILADEGLPDVPVIGVSATRGDGVDDLKRELAARIRAKSSAKARLTSDIAAAAAVIEQVGGSSEAPGISEAARRTLDDALVDSAGVPQIVEAIESSTRRRAALATGWPVLRWLGRGGDESSDELALGGDLSPCLLYSSPCPRDCRW
ncbi:50S ribosome-binding GTPase [Aeromicrobium fastidiosum]|uniref:GTPase family protein n=1 Tax=Aeromicrobium fastidiosum TaxID=52699 RepID=UPI0020233582|nr:GTPase [Aeromicrobium fastidiosum]MCL8251533.1 50S ribosome-binding GTPase [Aeromicrobium fastidiosum]